MRTTVSVFDVHSWVKGKKRGIMGNIFKKTSRSKSRRPVFHSNGDRQHTDGSSGATRVRRQPPPPPVPTAEPTAEPEDLIVKAMYDFTGMNEDDLPFKRGDIMRVEPHSHRDEWWIAIHLNTGNKGYIPSNYVCKNDGSLESQDYWLDVEAGEARGESEIVLMLPGNRAGTFVVRRSSDNNAAGVLSVRYDNAESGNPSVAHYKLRKTDSGKPYISPRRIFSNTDELIQHYSHHCDGLATRLTKPCPRIQPVEGFDQLEIDRDSISLENKIGEGCFGEVWKGKIDKRLPVAIKTLKPGKMEKEKFIDEAKIMHQLRHKKLVRLLAVCSKDEPILIVTEFMANGALLQFLKKDRGKLAKFTVLIKMAAQISDGMSYLEEKNFVHRDLRAANILVGQHYDVKVADFGLARVVNGDIYLPSEDIKFPIKWSAPESLVNHEFSVKSDVWSFGVLLFELITRGKNPYPGMSNREVTDQVPEGYRMPQPAECPNAYYEKMMQCWTHEPEQRPTFEHLHDFFDDFAIGTDGSYKEASCTH